MVVLHTTSFVNIIAEATRFIFLTANHIILITLAVAIVSLRHGIEVEDERLLAFRALIFVLDFHAGEVDDVKRLVEGSSQLLVGQVEGEAHGIPHILILLGVDITTRFGGELFHKHELSPAITGVDTLTRSTHISTACCLTSVHVKRSG